MQARRVIGIFVLLLVALPVRAQWYDTTKVPGGVGDILQPFTLKGLNLNSGGEISAWIAPGTDPEITAVSMLVRGGFTFPSGGAVDACVSGSRVGPGRIIPAGRDRQGHYQPKCQQSRGRQTGHAFCVFHPFHACHPCHRRRSPSLHDRGKPNCCQPNGPLGKVTR